MANITYFVEMPLESDLSYSYSMSLEGISFQFRLYWNTRSSQWHMDILTDEQVDVVTGLPLVSQYPMLEDFNLEDVGLTGHFVLLPVNVSLTSQLSLEAKVMPEFFRLYYVYDLEV